MNQVKIIPLRKLRVAVIKSKRLNACRLSIMAMPLLLSPIFAETAAVRALAYAGTPSAAQIDRFIAGFDTPNPVLNDNSAYLGLNYNLSGVGWLPGTGLTTNYPVERVHSLTMISPLNFAVAQHYSPGFFNYGTPLDFVNTSGNIIVMDAATLSTPSVPNYTADFAIGTMTQAFTPSQNVAVYSLLDVASYNYGGMPLIVYGSEANNAGPTIGTASIVSGSSYATPLGWNPGTGATGAAYWEGGDSGSPAFIPYMAPGSSSPQLTFAGTAWYPNSFNSYLPNPNAAGSPYDPVTVVNNILKTNGYALQWTIYVNSSDPLNSAPVWTGQADNGSIGSGLNWSNGIAPDNIPVVFNADGANGQTALTLNANTSLRGMLFQTSVSPNGFTFGGPGVLTLGYSGIRNEAAATQTFNVPITLSDSQNWEAVNGDLLVNGPVNTSNGNLVVIGGDHNTTINGVISGSGFIAKDGAGTLTLTAHNTYAGNTIIHNGTIDLGSAGALLPGTNLLFIGGNGVLVINGQNQSFSSILSEYGGTGQIVLNGGSVTDVTTLDGTTPFAGTISGNGTFYKNQTGILNLTGTNAQTGTLQVNRGIVRLSSPAAMPTTANLVINANDTSAVELGATNFTESLGTGAGQLRFIGTGNAGFGAYGGNRTVNLGGNGATVTWASGYFANANISLILATNTSTGTLNFENGINLNGAARTFVVDDGAAAIDAELSGVLSNGGLIKTGAGTLELTGANTYSGTTTIEDGTLLVGAAAALPSTTNIVLNGGVLELGAGNFNEALGTGAGQVQFTGNGGFSAYGANRSVSLNGGATLTWGVAPGFLGASQTLIFSSSSSNAILNFQNNINFNGGTGAIQTDEGTAGGINAELSGVLSNGGLTKTGAGTLELTGANTYSGATTIEGGALLVGAAASLPSTSNVVLNGGVLELGAGNFSGSLGTGAGQIQFTGNGGFSAYGANRSVSLNGGVELTWGATPGFVGATKTLIFSSSSSNATLTFQNNINFNGGTGTIQVDAGTTGGINAELGGVLSNGGLTKTGAGTLELTGANTYSGATTIEGGALLIGTGGGLPATSNVVLNGGVLELGAGNFNEALGTGAGQVQFAGNGGFAAYGGDREVNLGGADAAVTWNSTAGFLQNGQELILSAPSATGTVVFENPLVLGTGAAQVRTIYVNQGSTANGIDAIMAGAITAATSPQGLIKAGPGTLELQGLNNYGGPTTISDGTLLVTGQLNGGTAVDVQGPGTFVYNNPTVALADNVTINGGVYDYNSPAVYAGTLNIDKGTIGGTGSLANTALTLATGAYISPSYAAPGTLITGNETWSGGGQYLWQISNLSGTAGLASGWDLLKVHGTVILAATPGNQFIINISSAGTLTGWNPSLSYRWTILTAADPITNLNPADIFLDPSSFEQWNATGAGSFSLYLSGDNLNLVFSPQPIPEPASLIWFMAGIGTLLWLSSKKRGRLSGVFIQG